MCRMIAPRHSDHTRKACIVLDKGTIPRGGIVRFGIVFAIDRMLASAYFDDRFTGQPVIQGRIRWPIT